MATIKADQMAVEIVRIMTDYKGAIDVDVQKIAERVGKETAKKVRDNASSAGFGGTGKYVRSITSSTAKGHGAGYSGRVVYAKAPGYRLTHLLEHGHATVNGGRTRAFPHWESAEREGVAEFEKELREAIEHGS